MDFTTAQLETIATLSHARTPPDKIAEALGISEDAFKAWCARLALGRAWREPVLLPARPERKAPERLRMRAERYFEQATDAPQADEGEIAAAVEYYSV